MRGISFGDIFRKVFFCLSVLIVLLGTWNQEGRDGGGGGSHFGGRGNGLVSAQSCADFNKTSQAELCAPYVTYDYYLPPGPTKWIS
jgi:hypothetical protein